jgi:hypothetical protein
VVEKGVVSRTGVCSSSRSRLIAFMVRRRKLHGGSVYLVLESEGLHTQVNRGPSRVSRLDDPLAAGSSGLPQSRGPCTQGTDNSIPNPQNAYRRFTLPSHRSIHLLTTVAYSQVQMYVLMCTSTAAGRACSLSHHSPISVHLHENTSKSRVGDDKVRHSTSEG